MEETGTPRSRVAKPNSKGLYKSKFKREGIVYYRIGLEKEAVRSDWGQDL